MKRLLLLILLCCYGSISGQNLTRNHIIYESKDQLILNNGKEYDIIATTSYYEVKDPTIFQYKRIFDHVLRLKRVLTLKHNDQYLLLIEWNTNNTRFYESRKIKRSLISSNTAIGK